MSEARKSRRFSRRRLLAAFLACAPLAIIGDAKWVEPKWVTLYVNPGIGWFPVPIRFNCRPEVTVFEM
jgi:hypothetical protein